MKTLVIVGSRNREGQTARAVRAYTEGLGEGGSDIETVFLTEMQVGHCKQCDQEGWGGCLTRGICSGQQDDFQGLVDKIRAADAVVFATPVYWGDLAESLKAFLDRFRRTCTHKDGKKGVAGKPALGLGVAGGGGGGSCECMRRLEDTLHHCGFDVVDLVPTRRQNLELKLAVLELTGKWFAGKIGAEKARSK